MYPLEMSFDEVRVGFIDINNENLILDEIKFMDLDHTKRRCRELKNKFYLLSSTKDYILKINRDRDVNDSELRQMIEKLYYKQPNIDNIDFPIGYVKDDNNTIGQIIKYYQNAKSFKTIILTEDYEDLQKNIYLDDDSLHNLFLVYLNILEQIEKLFENNIIYLDIHSGNIVFSQNEVKIIDFEPNYIRFKRLKCYYEQIIYNYMRLVNMGLSFYYLDGELECVISETSFRDLKRKVKTLENTVRTFM